MLDDDVLGAGDSAGGRSITVGGVGLVGGGGPAGGSGPVGRRDEPLAARLPLATPSEEERRAQDESGEWDAGGAEVGGKGAHKAQRAALTRREQLP